MIAPASTTSSTTETSAEAKAVKIKLEHYRVLSEGLGSLPADLRRSIAPAIAVVVDAVRALETWRDVLSIEEAPDRDALRPLLYVRSGLAHLIGLDSRTARARAEKAMAESDAVVIAHAALVVACYAARGRQ